MRRLIDRADLFNRLSDVKEIDKAFAVIHGMEVVDAIPVSWIKRRISELPLGSSREVYYRLLLSEWEWAEIMSDE